MFWQVKNLSQTGFTLITPKYMSDKFKKNKKQNYRWFLLCSLTWIHLSSYLLSSVTEWLDDYENINKIWQLQSPDPNYLNAYGRLWVTLVSIFEKNGVYPSSRFLET